MAQNSNKRNYRVRYDRIIYCAIILVVMILLLTSCISSCGKKNAADPGNTGSTNPGNVVDDQLTNDPSSVQESLPVVTEAGASGYDTISVSSDEMHRGDLILANADNPVEYDEDDVRDGTSRDISFVTIKSILDTHDSPKPYTAADWEIGLERSAALSMDAWFTAFYDTQGNRDLRMIGGYRPDSEDYDKHTGRCVVIGIFPEDGDSYYYSPEGDYAWLDEHSAEYGFVLRYPEDKTSYYDDSIVSRRNATYRYVGIPAATYIQENSLCLEEFLEKIKNYSIDSMLQVTQGDAQYGMYYIPAAAAGGDTSFSVPSDLDYSISGNNVDGFIITAYLNEAAQKTKNLSLGSAE